MKNTTSETRVHTHCTEESAGGLQTQAPLPQQAFCVRMEMQSSIAKPQWAAHSHCLDLSALMKPLSHLPVDPGYSVSG